MKKNNDAKAIPCCNCKTCQASLNRTEIGACKKILGRDTENWYCLHCLAEALETTTEYITEMIGYWKEQGCTLFQ